MAGASTFLVWRWVRASGKPEGVYYPARNDDYAHLSDFDPILPMRNYEESAFYAPRVIHVGAKTLDWDNSTDPFGASVA